MYSYIYDATGVKHAKFIDGSETGDRYYIGNMEYNQTQTLEYIHTSEGRVRYNGVDYAYDYYLKDHLGNTRVSFTESSTVPGQVEALQVDNYYPFGMRFNQAPILQVEENNYLYNGKELQKNYGLDWYDYGARYCDPALGRFTTKDPLSESFFDYTPYHYVHNNPVRLIDPTGMSAEDPQEGDYDEETDTYYSDRFGWVSQQFYSFLTQGGYQIKDNNEAMDVFLQASGLKGGGDKKEEESTENSEVSFEDLYAKALDAMVDAGEVVLPWVPFVGGVYEYSSGQITDGNASEATLVLTLLIDGVPGGSGAKNFFKGSRYTTKVLRQMSKVTDLHHSFPTSVDGFAANYGKLTTIVGGDNKVYQKLTVQGTRDGVKGTFTYIKDALGNINKRQFIPD